MIITYDGAVRGGSENLASNRRYKLSYTLLNRPGHDGCVILYKMVNIIQCLPFSN